MPLAPHPSAARVPPSPRSRGEGSGEGPLGSKWLRANLRPERTGLPFVVFISQRGGARHDVRIKLARAAKARPPDNMASREFDLVARWIDLNLSVLIDYWNGVIEYTEDALNVIKPVSQS